MTVRQQAYTLIDQLPDDCVEKVVQVMIQMLPDNKVHAAKREQWNSPLGIKTEEQLWEHIDRSLVQARAGMGKDADELIEELTREYAV